MSEQKQSPSIVGRTPHTSRIRNELAEAHVHRQLERFIATHGWAFVLGELSDIAGDFAFTANIEGPAGSLKERRYRDIAAQLVNAKGAAEEIEE